MAGKRLTKAQIITELANSTDLDKKTVNRLFEELFALIKKQLGTRGPGEFVVSVAWIADQGVEDAVVLDDGPNDGPDNTSPA